MIYSQQPWKKCLKIHQHHAIKYMYYYYYYYFHYLCRYVAFQLCLIFVQKHWFSFVFHVFISLNCFPSFRFECFSHRWFRVHNVWIQTMIKDGCCTTVADACELFRTVKGRHDHFHCCTSWKITLWINIISRRQIHWKLEERWRQFELVILNGKEENGKNRTEKQGFFVF